MEEFFKNNIITIVGIIIALFLLHQLYLLFKSKKEPPLYAPMHCQTCGWTGKVSRNNKKCHMCGSTDMVFTK